MSQTATQMGGVGGGLPADTIVGVQLLFTGIAVPLSLLAGLLQQQRTEHRALVDVEHQNRAILRALPDTTLLHTKDGAIVQSYPPRVDDAPASRADAEEPHVREYSEGAGEAARRYEARSVAVDGERTLTIIRDITERWRAQQALIEAQRRYTLALSAGGIGVWHYDVAVPLNLNAVVREVVRIATPRLRALHVRVQEALDPAIPNVYADDVQMQQVLFNLVLNARDALRGVDTNRRVVRVSTRHTRRHVIVSVRDTGIGLDRADTSRIFEPFYTTKETGTGVGLAISRSIVQSHGGTLGGVSNSDFGSTFRFKIPLPTSDATPAPHHTTRVLVVDDDRGMRTALKRLLSGSGYDVAVASNGARAVALTETFRPDAAVIDMSLGEMSGLHLVKRLRALYADRSLFLIALTAYEDEHLRHACLAAGFNAYLVKQTQISELPVLLEQRSG
jgi:signal transduction histidine kinase